MDTKIANVKVKYIRPKYQNLKEWCEDENNVYIGRGGVVFVDKVRYPPKSSPFANPFKIGKGDCDRDNVVELYSNHLKNKIENGEITKGELLSLRGKTLGCWCKPERCHGDVILEFLNEMEELDEDATN